MRELFGSPKNLKKRKKHSFSYMSENLITCKGANRFSLSELVREPGQEPGEHLRTTQLGLYNTSLYSSGKDAKPSKSFTHRQTMNPLI